MRSLFVALAASLVACSSTPPAQPPGGPGQGGYGQPAGNGNQPPGPATGGDSSGAPMSASLASVASNPATGDTDIQLTLDIHSPPPFPLTVSVALPAGAQLVGGLPSEALSVTQRGQITRVFRVRGALSPQAPFRVGVHGDAPGRGYGIHSDLAFPRAAQAAPLPVGGPPGGRPPVAPPRR